MDKILITLDFGAIRNSHIKPRTFQSKGQEVTRNELNLELVPLKEQVVISDKPEWQLLKTHFVCIAQNKEERERREPTVFVGEGKMFVSKGPGLPF